MIHNGDHLQFEIDNARAWFAAALTSAYDKGRERSAQTGEGSR